MTCLKLVRWTAGLSLLLLLMAVILTAVPLAVLAGLVSDRSTFPSWLDESNTYDRALEIGFELAELKSKDSEAITQLLAEARDPGSESGKLLREIVSAERVRRDTQVIVNAVYDWLQGKTKLPQFEVALIDKKDDLVRLLQLGLRQRLRDLPPCPSGEVPNLNRGFEDLDCWPEGVGTDLFADIIAANLTTDNFTRIKSDLTFTGDSLGLTPEMSIQAQSLFALAALFPTVTAASIFLLIVLTASVLPDMSGKLLTSLGIAFSGLTLLAAGAFILAGLGSSLEHAFSQLPREIDRIASVHLTALAHAAVTDAVSRVQFWGLTLVVAGLILTLVILIATSHRGHKIETVRAKGSRVKVRVAEYTQPK